MIKAELKDLFDQEQWQERYFSVMFGGTEIFYFEDLKSEEVIISKIEGFGSEKGGGLQISIQRPSSELIIRSMQQAVDNFKKMVKNEKK